MLKKNPSPSDIRAGAVLYAMRHYRGLSQNALGAAAGISFQQVQKYEKGFNSMRVEMLEKMAAILEMPVMAFFTGLDMPQADMLALDRDEIRLLQLWRALPGDGRRKHLLGLLTPSP